MNLYDEYKEPGESAMEELKKLDERLKVLQKKFASSKTDNVQDSLFTSDNLKSAIGLLKTINPSEKNMVRSLETLVPLAEKPNEVLGHLNSKKNAATHGPEVVSTPFTKQLKCKLPQNRLI
ncbi:MAG: hypothetical protein LBJ78_00410 [Puniceicoccales bacterium]|jgi:hypothetical protein|nr:hypothetical protein [Puniceicoccales bacterium]